MLETIETKAEWEYLTSTFQVTNVNVEYHFYISVKVLFKNTYIASSLFGYLHKYLGKFSLETDKHAGTFSIL